MNVADVEARVQHIAEHGPDDPEGAHIEEDKLYKDVLGAIAAGHPDAPALAAAALKADDLDFSRWYA